MFTQEQIQFRANIASKPNQFFKALDAELDHSWHALREVHLVSLFFRQIFTEFHHNLHLK